MDVLYASQCSSLLLRQAHCLTSRALLRKSTLALQSADHSSLCNQSSPVYYARLQTSCCFHWWAFLFLLLVDRVAALCPTGVSRAFLAISRESHLLLYWTCRPGLTFFLKTNNPCADRDSLECVGNDGPYIRAVGWTVGIWRRFMSSAWGPMKRQLPVSSKESIFECPVLEHLGGWECSASAILPVQFNQPLHHPHDFAVTEIPCLSRLIYGTTQFFIEQSSQPAYQHTYSCPSSQLEVLAH